VVEEAEAAAGEVAASARIETRREAIAKDEAVDRWTAIADR
jgi:hypothetical protein